jgi:AsmA protein
MLKWALAAIALLAVLAGGALAAIPYLVDLPAVQAYVTQTASDALGRPLRYRSLSFSALPLPSIRLRELEVGDDPRFGPGPALTVEEGRLGLRLRPLLSGRIELTHLALQGVHLAVIENAGGQLNVATLGASPGGPRPPPLLLGRVTVSKGTVRFQRYGKRPADLHLEDVAVTAVVRGRPDEFDLRAEAIARPGGLRLSIAEGRLGPLGARTLGEAPLRAVVDVRAPDLGPIAALVMSSPTLTGPVVARLTVEGPVSRLSATGSMRLDHLVAASTRPRCPSPIRRLEIREVQVPLRYSTAGVESSPVQARVAGGTVAARLHATGDGAATVSVRELSVRGVQLEPVLVEYLCQGYAVTGALDLTGEGRARMDDPLRTMSGEGRLRVGPGKVVGGDALAAIAELIRVSGMGVLPSERALRGRSPLGFESITATYRVADGVVRSDDLLYTGAGFRVTGTGSYGIADGRVELHVTLHQGLNQVEAVVAGTAPGRVRIVPTAVRPTDPRDLRRFIDRLLR